MRHTRRSRAAVYAKAQHINARFDQPGQCASGHARHIPLQQQHLSLPHHPGHKAMYPAASAWSLAAMLNSIAQPYMYSFARQPPHPHLPKIKTLNSLAWRYLAALCIASPCTPNGHVYRVCLVFSKGSSNRTILLSSAVCSFVKLHEALSCDRQTSQTFAAACCQCQVPGAFQLERRCAPACHARPDMVATATETAMRPFLVAALMLDNQMQLPRSGQDMFS